MSALTHTLALTGRELTHWKREPWGPLFNLLFSVMTLVMFLYLFGGAIDVGGRYVDYLLPGLLALTMMFGVESTMTAVATDARRGVTDRFRSLPVAAGVVPASRLLADLLNSAVQLAALMAIGLAFGWRPEGGPVALVVAVGLLLWLRAAMLWLGIWLGLQFRSEQAVMAVQVLVWPAAFLSGVFVPTDTMPAWLGALAAWNPVSVTAQAVRDLVTGGDAALLGAVAVPAALMVVFVPLAVRSFRRP